LVWGNSDGKIGKLLAERGLGDQQFGTFSGVHLGVFSSLALREAQSQKITKQRESAYAHKSASCGPRKFPWTK
jgi:hypothetical protein